MLADEPKEVRHGQRASQPSPEGYTAATPWIISRDTAGLLDFVQEAFDAVELARLDRVGRVRDSLGKLWWIQARVESVDEAETVRRLGDPEWAAPMEYVQGSPRIP